MTITLDPTLSKQLSDGMKNGDGVELPFLAPYIWAVNGLASFKPQAETVPAMYYGGWAVKMEDMQACIDQLGVPLPPTMKQATIPSRDGKEFEAYTTRTLIVAPIAYRSSWLYDGRRYMEYVDGGRRHVQALVYMGIKATPKTIEPWGPAILTAKGYQAKNLLDAFSAWDKHTSAIRYKVAPGVPAWCFYLSIGTFGKERQSINVGKPGSQSPITPIGPGLIELNETLMNAIFVGEKVAGAMGDFREQAQPWLKAWKQPDADGNVDHFAQGQQGNGGEDGTESISDEVPF